MKILIAFIKKNVFSCVCFLLALAVCVSGAISYARYTTGNSSNNSSDAASFVYSADITDVSALSLINSQFWGSTGNTEDDKKIALNYLRWFEFSIKNHQTQDGVQKVNEVKVKYALTFVAPKNFVEKLAFQIFRNPTANEDGDALIPQIVMPDLLAASDTYSVPANSEYNGTDVNDDLLLTLSKNGQTLVAKSNDVTITVEPIRQELTQTLQFRLYDVASLNKETVSESEATNVIAPLNVELTSIVDCYRVSVAMSDFVLPAGVAETHNYELKLVPVSELNDEHIGHGLANDENGEKLKTIYSGKEVYVMRKIVDSAGNATTTATANTLGRVWREIEETDQNGQVVKTKKEHTEAEKLELYGANSSGVTIQKYYLSNCYSKSYPLSVNVPFEQTR